MINKIQLLVVLVLLIALSSCYSYRGQRLLQENSRSVPNYAKAEYVDYRIRPNDEIIYRLVTSDETISKLLGASTGSTQNQMSYRVYADGTIDLPFVSHIKVGGLTLLEASKEVENRFKEQMPDASVKLSLANKTFTVIGSAGTGQFTIYKEKLTIFQALSQSGDFNETSDRKHIRIIRESDKGLKVLEFDIRPKSIIDSKYYYIYPNDIIYVRQDPSAFYKVNNYSSLLGIITFSMSLLFNVLNY